MSTAINNRPKTDRPNYERTPLAYAIFNALAGIIQHLPIEDYRAWPIHYSLSLHQVLVGCTRTGANTSSCA